MLLDQGSTGTAVLDAQTRRGLLLSIRSDAQWLNATVENLLAITKLEGGGMRLSTTLELMDDIVEEALRHVNPAVREHDLKVVACDEPALVNVDARLMVQLVVNLVNNAITYTPAGSHIMISISVDDGRVACSVADDGPGIAPEDRERIFESFYTANHGLADSHRSVGLGLSLCRSIALAHGGSIEVAAADPHGSVFTIELPSPMFRLIRSSVVPNSAVKPLILVVEDDPAVRNLIVAALEAHGLRHMAVETAHAAIAAASSQAPSIVLLDLGLPDMDGVKVVESVRAWSGMPIIVVSARSEDADKIRALDAGADDYLTKPFSVEAARAHSHDAQASFVCTDRRRCLRGLVRYRRAAYRL